jgi:hypothetical protein
MARWAVCTFPSLFQPYNKSYPDATADAPPNWFYYYNQVYPSPGDYTSQGVSQAFYSPSGNYGRHSIVIGDDASRPYKIPVFVKSDLGVHCAGYVTVYGILSYIQTCGHENGHVEMMKVKDSVPFPYDKPFVDADGDWLNDTWEAAHHLSSSSRDTFKIAPLLGIVANPNPATESMDNEVPAHIEALKQVLAKWEEAWQQDWSGTGVQAGQWGPKNRDKWHYWLTPAERQNKFPTHPWFFTPMKFNGGGWIRSGPDSMDLPKGYVTEFDQLM